MVYLSAVTGLTISIQLYDGTTSIGSSATMTEISGTGEYFVNVPAGVPSGQFWVIATTTGGTVKIASGQLYWNGVEEVSPEMYDELHKIAGLDINNPMTATSTNRSSGDISLTISGYGTGLTSVQRD